MRLFDWYDKGFDADEYIHSMEKNKAGMLEIYNNFTLTEVQKTEIEKVRHLGLKVIALTEDWCGDAMLNNAILMKIAEAGGIEIRFLLRDENPELMDKYLTNGTSRAIPIYIFVDKNGEEYAVWGPRAQKVQELLDRGRNELPNKEDADFEEKQKQFYMDLVDSYQNDKGIWQTVAESIIHKLA